MFSAVQCVFYRNVMIIDIGVLHLRLFQNKQVCIHSRTVDVSALEKPEMREATSSRPGNEKSQKCLKVVEKSCYGMFSTVEI